VRPSMTGAHRAAHACRGADGTAGQALPVTRRVRMGEGSAESEKSHYLPLHYVTVRLDKSASVM